MPKVKLTDYEQKRTVARVILKSRAELKRVSDDTLAKRLHCAVRTIQDRWRHPEMLRLRDMWTLVETLNLSDAEIIQIMRGKEDVDG